MTEETQSVTPEPTPDAPAPERTGPTPGELVALKSPDVAKASSEEYVKTFTLPPGPKPSAQDGHSHDAYLAETVRAARSSGLNPTGEPRHVSTKKHHNGASWVLTYAVPAVPVETEPTGTPEA